MPEPTEYVETISDLVRGGGPAIPSAFRASEDSHDGGDGTLLHQYAEGLCSFLKEQEWLFECHITEFFTDRLWCERE